ncbi:hypothetical protein Tco_0827644 [Tanacetum coccineum]
MTNLEFCDKHNIVNWEYILLGMTEAKDSKVCKITRADGSSSFHGDIQALSMGDLRMIFDPNEEDDIWLNQQYWELLRWKLHEYSGVHSLFLDGTVFPPLKSTYALSNWNVFINPISTLCLAAQGCDNDLEILPVGLKLAIKFVDEYGFVIRPSLVGLTFRSCEDRLVIRWIHLKKNLLDRISSISIRSSNVQPSESPYLPVPLVGTSQSRQHDKSESVSYYLTD